MQLGNTFGNREAYTLIELMIGMTISLIVLSSVYSIYTSQQRLYRKHQLVIESQQNLRSAMIIVEQQLRMAGYDPNDSGKFGITDVRRYDMVGTSPNSKGKPAVSFLRDVNENGSFDGGKEKCSFSIRKDNKNGRTYLAWNMGSGRFPLAEDIQEIGFAYAVDMDQDGFPDVSQGTKQVRWFVDSDNDNLLDLDLDTNRDGLVDEQDDVDGDGIISKKDSQTICKPIVLNKIKLIRIWMLAVAPVSIQGFDDRRKYCIGDRIIDPASDGLYRIACETIVDCRNL